MNTYDIQRYRIPDTRLPFVNTEIAGIDFQGSGHLVSSICGGKSVGRLYFWNPDTGSHDFRELPNNIPGAYMLKQGPDRLLYIGCGNGDLARYDPRTDRFKMLVTDEMHSITWGGCVTDRYVIWAASPGEVGVYDWQNEELVKVFRPFDTEEPTALYGHSAVESPDGKVIVAMNVPQTRVIVLDIETMTRISYTPVALAGAGFVYDMAFVDNDSLGMCVGGEFIILSYPGFELKSKVASYEGITRVSGWKCAPRGEYYAVGTPPGSLLKLDREGECWNMVEKGWTDGNPCIVGVWQERDVCAVTVGGIALRYDPDKKTTDMLDLESTGHLPAHALCAVPDKGIIVGAPFINQRFWTIDLDTGQGRDCGRAAPGGGQINQIVWDPVTSKTLLTSYTTCSVTAFDPSQFPGWPNNPLLVASAHNDGQMRPMALVHDGRYVWMATSPEYGTLGGALCRIDPNTGDINVWRHIVPDQKINAIVLDTDKRRVYCSSEIYADCKSAPATQTTGKLVAFDMDTLEVLRTDTIRQGAPLLKLHTLLPDSSVLVQDLENLYAWNPDTGSSRLLGALPQDFRQALTIPGHGILVCAQGCICRLFIEGDTLRIVPLMQEHGNFLHVAAGTLYYACGENICAVNVEDLFAKVE